jgi:hypothetical protein
MKKEFVGEKVQEMRSSEQANLERNNKPVTA